ncbi:hypothetical protein QTP88_017080 [Uroleucon formosanum]
MDSIASQCLTAAEALDGYDDNDTYTRCSIEATGQVPGRPDTRPRTALADPIHGHTCGRQLFIFREPRAISRLGSNTG